MNFTKTAKTVNRLISENGKNFDFIKAGGTLIDASQPWKGSSGEVTVTLKAVRVPLSAGLGQTTEYQGLVTFSDEMLLVYPDTHKMQNFTHVQEDGIRKTITDVQTLDPSGTPLLAFIKVRR